MTRFKPHLLSLLILFVLLCLSLVAIWPLTRGTMLLTDDGTLHLYRTVVLDHSLRYDDSLYPRYSSALALGYGAPLFTYFSPLAYYLPRTLHVIGLGFVQAWLGSMVIYLWLALGGAYVLGKMVTDRRGGLIAAVSYLYAPYLLYDAISRGTLTEVAALAMLPWVLATLTRLAQRPSAWRFVLAVFSYGLFIPLHNIVTLHGSLLIAAYCLFLTARYAPRHHVLLRLVGVGLFGLGITAFFWLPALGETALVKINAVTASLPMLDVTTHLRPLSAVLALPIAVDPLQQQASIPITVSWIALALGSVAIFRRQQRGQALFWWAVVIVCLFMNTELSAWVWRTLPLLSYTQFAWRILGIASLALAVLAALGGLTLLEALRSGRARMGLLVVIIGMSVLYGLPFTYRPTLEISADAVLDAQQYERVRGEIALSSYSEYLPAWTRPPLADALRDAWAVSPTPSRLPSDVPIIIQSQTWRGTSGTFDYQSATPQTITLNWLYMPQWAATLDGEPLAITYADSGLLQISLPDGQHRVQITYGLSAMQQLAWIVSLFSFIMGIVLVGLWWRRRVPYPQPFPHRMEKESRDSTFPSPLDGEGSGVGTRLAAHEAESGVGTLVVLAVFGLALLILRLTVIDTTDNIFHRQRWQSNMFDRQPVRDAQFVGGLRLLSADTPQVNADTRTLTLNTFWTLDAPTQNKYGVVYRLLNAQGLTVAEQSAYQIAGLDTTRWQPGLYLQDRVTLAIPRGTPPGSYKLAASLYDTATLAPLPTINAAGNPDVPDVTLGYVVLPRMVTLAASIPAGDEPIAVLSVSGIPESALEGAPFTLKVTYAAQITPTDASTVQLIALQGDTRFTLSDATELVSGWPTTDWRAGELWTGYIAGVVPLLTTADDSDTLTVRLRLSNSVGITDDFPFGTITVQTPDRTLERPVTEHPVALRWQNHILLDGYTLADRELALVWRTGTPLRQDLRLFVHVLDESDTIIAQRDGVPLDWTRPTTSWVPAEFITTSYTFDEIPSGTYRVRVGWYDPLTYQRISTDEGDTDSVTLPYPLIVP